MSTPHQVQAGDLLYTVVDDCTTTYWAIFTGEVTDEIMGAFDAPGFTVEAGLAGLATKTTDHGLFAVTGYPQQAFPKLAMMGTTVPLTFKAPGFRDHKIWQPVPLGTTFPVPVGTVLLRRLPVRIQGRVVNDLTRAPIAGALVLSVDNPVTPPSIHTTALRTPLYFDHASGKTAQLVTIASTDSATLKADVAVGSQVVRLSTRTGLGPGSIVQISSASNLVVEYGVVDHLGPGSAAAEGDVFFRNALNRSYSSVPTLAPVIQFVNATPMGGAVSLASDANAGDSVLLANELLNGGPLVVDAGTPGAEYHEVGALTDGDGYYALEGVGRVQQIFLQSSQGALLKTVGWFIEYDHAVNVVDLRLS